MLFRIAVDKTVHEPRRCLVHASRNSCRCGVIETDLGNGLEFLATANFLKSAAIAGEVQLVGFLNEHQQGRFERVKVEHAGQIDQATSTDDGGDVVVAQGGDAQRNWRRGVGGEQAEWLRT